jgi:hypothetical protein
MLLLSPAVLAVVLLAALLHAGWNVVVRAGTDRRRETILLVSGATVPFLPLPPIAAWRYLLTSAGLQTVFHPDRRSICARRYGACLSADARHCADADRACGLGPGR